MVVPEKRERKGKLFGEKTAENFPNLGKETNIQVQEAKSHKRWTQRDPHQNTL